MEKIEELTYFLNKKFSLDITFSGNYVAAFTHSSYINENHGLDKKNNYERLEFLGDAALEIATSEYLFKKFPHLSEGELTKLRASIVCEPTLVKYAKEFYFDEYILLGKGEEKTGGRTRPALLADIFESFIGALYLDKGLSLVKKFLEKSLFKDVTDDSYQAFVDYKTILQELVSKEKLGSVQYKLISSEGPSHDKNFVSNVYIGDVLYGEGSAKTKKESEQKCANQALKKMKNL